MPHQAPETTSSIPSTTAPSRGADSSEFELAVPAAILLSAVLVAGSILYGSSDLGARLRDLRTSPPVTAVSPAPSPIAAPTTPSAAQLNETDANQKVDVALGAYPVLGKKDAKVTIVEFSDLECPFCEKFDTETFPQLKKEYIDTGKVRFAYRHYILPSHSNAPKAAEAVACANGQGKSWELIEAIFSDQKNITVADLKKKAAAAGLNATRFDRCLDSGEKKSEVDQDQSEGTKAGVTGTPTFFINGKRLVGAQPFSQFQAAIERELAN